MFVKYSENAQKHLSGLQNNFKKSLGIFGKWLETFENRQKWPHPHVYITKRTFHVSFKRCDFYVLVRSLVRQFLPLKHKIQILSPLCNILYIQSYTVDAIAYLILTHLTKIFCSNPNSEKLPIILIVNILL